MFFKFPEDTADYSWTRHVKNKMLFYGLSEAKIKGVIRNPKRKEEGVAENTVAVMRPSAGKKKEEIWAMYTNKSKIKIQKSKLTVISAWRYPGISKPGKMIPIPEDIREELGL